MRTTFNPVYKEKEILIKFRHRVIVPVYIPEKDHEGYFKESLEVLKISISSLLETISVRTCITIVLNGWNENVSHYLKGLFERKKIDSLVLHQENKGKINSVLDVGRSCLEEFITITDADVYFHKGWESAVMDVFKNEKKALAVSPLAMPNIQFKNTVSTLVSLFFTRKLKVIEVVDVSGIVDFFKSIKRDEVELGSLRMLGISNKNFSAFVGAPHFCYTLHQSVFQESPPGYATTLLSGKNEDKFMDSVIDKMGGYRLSTFLPYVQHIGNSLEGFKKANFKEHDLLKYSDRLEIPKRNVAPIRFLWFWKRLLLRTRVRNILINR